MTLVAVLGDATTTTSVALAAVWPLDDDVIVLEADPSGGSLAGWLDVTASPTLATIVATGGDGPDGVMATIRSMTRSSESSIRFIAAPVRALAAHRAIDEAVRVVVPAIAADPTMVALADLGRPDPAGPPAIVRCASMVVIVHRQDPRSVGAETVRLERFVELIEQLAASGASPVAAIIGNDPFDPAEIAQFLDESVPTALAQSVTLADDPLAAAVLAGRTGVSASRLRRLPLMRTAAAATVRLRTRLPLETSVGTS